MCDKKDGFGAMLTKLSGVYPKLLVEIVSKWNSGKKDEAADFFYRHVPLMRFEFQEGIGMAIRKEMLRRRGALKHAGIRQPGATLDRSTLDTLDRILKWFDLY
jgi:4-hydroxy-tetrahydrodipicolinate synthase